MNKVVYIQDIGNIEFRYSSKFRRLSIRLSTAGNLWLNIPKGLSDKHALEFIKDNKDWILNNISKVKTRKNNNRIWESDFLTTKFYEIKIHYEDIKTPQVRILENKISLHIPIFFDDAKIDEAKEYILSHVYRLESEHFLPTKINELSKNTGLSFSKLSFRNNKTNWGSCSYQNNISLNIQLMKLPYDIIEYVLIHELCHTIEKNHSQNFWILVEKNCPDYIKLRKRLKSYSTQILNY